jgi:hypothetical protein
MRDISVTADDEFDEDLMRFRQKWNGYRATGDMREQKRQSRPLHAGGGEKAPGQEL